MRRRSPLAWLGRWLERKFTAGMLPFDGETFDAYVDTLGKELTR